MFRDKYKLSFSDEKLYKDIVLDVACDHAERAYEKVWEMTWIIADYIMWIIGYDDQALKMDVLIDSRAIILDDRPLERIDIVHRYSLKVDGRDAFHALIYRNDAEEINAVCAELSWLDNNDFNAVKILKKENMFIIEIKDGVEIPELDILTEYVYAEEE